MRKTLQLKSYYHVIVWLKYIEFGFVPLFVHFATASKTTTTAATSTTALKTTNSTTSTGTTVSTQTAQPKAAKSGSSLVISSIPPGTYSVSNALNPTQSKVFTVTSKACLVGDRTLIGSPSKFLVTRQGLTFPIDWSSLPTIPAAAIPQC